MSGDKIALADGEWALFRDPTKVPERLRRPVSRHIVRISAAGMEALADPQHLAGNLPVEDLDSLADSNDLLVIALVEQWSYTDSDQPLPVTVDALLGIPGCDYSTLLSEAASRFHLVFPDFSPSKANTADPTSPTGPSSE